MIREMTYYEYLSSIVELLCYKYGFTEADAHEVINEYEDVLPVFFLESRSVAEVARFISEDR